MRKILLNTIVSVLYYAVNIFINFWITSILVADLGREAYGMYPLAINISGWMVIITIAVNGMLARHITVSYSQNNVRLAKEYYSTAMIADLRIAGCLLIPILIIVFFADFLFNIPVGYTTDAKILFLLVFLTVPLEMFITVFSVSYVVKDRIYLQNLARTFQCLVKGGFLIVMEQVTGISLSIVGIAVFIASILYAVVVFVSKACIMPEIGFERGLYQIVLLRSMLVSGMWQSVIHLGNLLLMTCDVIVANICAGADQSALVSLAVTVPGGITSIVTMLNMLFYPGLLKQYATDRTGKRFVARIHEAQVFVGGGMSLFIVCIISVITDFYKLWVPGSDPLQLKYLTTIYLIPIIVSGCFRIVGDVLLVIDDLKAQGILTIVCGVANVVSMIILMKAFNMGAAAAAYTTCVILVIWYIIILPYLVSKKTDIKIWMFYFVPVSVVLLLVVSVPIISYIASIIPLGMNWLSLVEKALWVGVFSLVIFGIYYLFMRWVLNRSFK